MKALWENCFGFAMNVCVSSEVWGQVGASYGDLLLSIYWFFLVSRKGGRMGAEVLPPPLKGPVAALVPQMMAGLPLTKILANQRYFWKEDSCFGAVVKATKMPVFFFPQSFIQEVRLNSLINYYPFY